jgi:pimeloyl-ACP methyl ester carboxylesterase
MSLRKQKELQMSVSLLERQPSLLPTAEFVRQTSFGANIYEGHIDHEDGRRNPYYETAPLIEAVPDSVVLIEGGYLSGYKHYQGIQRQLALRGERSVFVGHEKHGGYQVGHNTCDVTQTGLWLVENGVQKIILLGHSQGAHEVVDAYEKMRVAGLGKAVSDIVLAFPACVVEGYVEEFVRNAPLFALESLVGFIKNPIKQIKAGAVAARSAASDPIRIIKEGANLATNATVTASLDALKDDPDRPRVHFVVGLLDGLTSGKSIAKTVIGGNHHHDTFTLLRAGHVDFNSLPAITDIILGKVRG